MLRKLKGKGKMPALEANRHLVLFEGISIPAVAISSLQTPDVSVGWC